MVIESEEVYNNIRYPSTIMKLACAIATVAAIHQAAAECDFGSNYTFSFTSSGYCDFEIGYGQKSSSIPNL